MRTLSYDQVVDLLSKIESDSFDEKYSTEELDQINQFISFLAMEGVTNDEKIAMESAVASLFRNDTVQYALLDSRISYSAKPAIYIEGTKDFVLCKNWFKKQERFIDESPVKIQEKVKCATDYMWGIVEGQGADPPYRIELKAQKMEPMQLMGTQPREPATKAYGERALPTLN